MQLCICIFAYVRKHTVAGLALKGQTKKRKEKRVEHAPSTSGAGRVVAVVDATPCGETRASASQPSAAGPRESVSCPAELQLAHAAGAWPGRTGPASTACWSPTRGPRGASLCFRSTAPGPPTARLRVRTTTRACGVRSETKARSR